MKYRLVIFDFDGTLADSFPFFVGSVNELATRHGFAPLPPEALESMRGKDARTILTSVGLPLWKVPELASDYVALMAQHLDQIPLFAGVVALLDRLADAGVALALVSSNADRNVRRVLGHACAKRFQIIECGVSLFGKRARLKKVLRAARIAAHDALYVGDEIRDAEAAQGAGIAFGAVTWGYATAASLRAQNPALWFTSPGEIGDVVLAP